MWAVLAAIAIAACPAARAESDFAVEVVGYVPGTGITYDWISYQLFDDPEKALGRPTVDTTGDGWYISPVEQPVPVVVVDPPFRWFEIVTVGEGGRLVLKFDHPVEDDPRNPYGMDFILFGNASQAVGGEQGWLNGDPNGTSVGADAIVEQGVISVSQDGRTWHAFTGGPYADGFAPTLGRVYSPCSPDRSLGAWNRWWGEPTDPTIPAAPSLTPANFAGLSVAEISKKYGRSAGGVGFDIASVGLAWIQYVKIENPPASGYTPEVDAVADVAPACIGGRPFMAADFDRDCDVDGVDFGHFAACFNGTGNPVPPGCCDVDLNADGSVDGGDYGVFAGCFNGTGQPPACE